MDEDDGQFRMGPASIRCMNEWTALLLDVQYKSFDGRVSEEEQADTQRWPEDMTVLLLLLVLVLMVMVMPSRLLLPAAKQMSLKTQ